MQENIKNKAQHIKKKEFSSKQVLSALLVWPHRHLYLSCMHCLRFLNFA